MAHSLEVRVPFLSQSYRRESHRLPMDWRLSLGGEEKAALRVAAAQTRLQANIVSRPKLPAGRATSLNLLKHYSMNSFPSSDAIIGYPLLAGALKNQPEIALGLGLFEAIHIHGEGLDKPSISTADLLSMVIE